MDGFEVLREIRADAKLRDGFEVLREIRADAKLRAIPIVFLSVFSDREELASEWVVSKPIEADELRQVLGAAVAARRSRVLVVGREQLRSVLEPALDELGVEHAAAALMAALRGGDIPVGAVEG